MALVHMSGPSASKAVLHTTCVGWDTGFCSHCCDDVDACCHDGGDGALKIRNTWVISRPVALHRRQGRVAGTDTGAGIVEGKADWDEEEDDRRLPKVLRVAVLPVWA